MKVTIKEWNAVASWRWDMPEDDVCGICRVQFDGTCPTCKYPGDDCALCECHPLHTLHGRVQERGWRSWQGVYIAWDVCMKSVLGGE